MLGSSQIKPKGCFQQYIQSIMDQSRARSLSPLLFTRSSCNPTRETEVTEADSFINECPSVSEQMSGLEGHVMDCSPGKSFLAPGNRAAVLKEMAKSLYHAIPGKSDGKSTAIDRLRRRESGTKQVGRRSDIGGKERNIPKWATKEVQTDTISETKPDRKPVKQAEIAVQTQFPAHPDPLSLFETRLHALETLHISPHSSPISLQKQVLDLKAQLASEQSARLQASSALEKHISEVRRLQSIVHSLQKQAIRPVISSSEAALHSKQSQVRAI